MINRIPAGWVAIARDTFEYSMRPWVGRRYEEWLRDSRWAHPVDPRGQVLVPSRIYDVFKKRRHCTPATAKELAAAGYPKLPYDPVHEATSGEATDFVPETHVPHPSTTPEERRGVGGA